MDIETLREYCISKKGVTESFPFGDDTLVFKAVGKIFALVNLNGDLSINLKCDPLLAIELRERYSSVTPGYHMNKKICFFVILLTDLLLIRKGLDRFQIYEKTGMLYVQSL